MIGSEQEVRGKDDEKAGNNGYKDIHSAQCQYLLSDYVA